jgi:glycosyltransferase involved in cell wall biosynthesis
MVRALIYIDELTSTSIPVEMAAEAHTQDGVEVTLVSHFDSTSDQVDPDVEKMEVPQIRLGASSRIDLGAIRQLRRICLKDEIDILHTHSVAVGTVAHLATLGTDVDIITTEHNDHRFHGHIKRISNAATYPIVDTIVSNSSSTKASLDWWERLFAANSQHVVIYNGVDINRIDSTAEADYNLNHPDGPLVVTVGRSVNQKNQETLLRSFQHVLGNNPEATLAIVGDGPLLEKHKKLASDLNIRDSTLFTGYLPRRENVYSVLDQSTLAVFPSWYEGFCVAAVEAMASGLPVVASDIEVFHEVIDKGGIYASPNNPEEFADKITKLLQKPQLRSEIADIAAERAKAKFPLERTGREYAQLYKMIAASY